MSEGSIELSFWMPYAETELAMQEFLEAWDGVRYLADGGEDRP